MYILRDHVLPEKRKVCTYHVFFQFFMGLTRNHDWNFNIGENIADFALGALETQSIKAEEVKEAHAHCAVGSFNLLWS